MANKYYNEVQKSYISCYQRSTDTGCRLRYRAERLDAAEGSVEDFMMDAFVNSPEARVVHSAFNETSIDGVVDNNHIALFAGSVGTGPDGRSRYGMPCSVMGGLTLPQFFSKRF